MKNYPPPKKKKFIFFKLKLLYPKNPKKTVNHNQIEEKFDLN